MSRIPDRKEIFRRSFPMARNTQGKLLTGHYRRRILLISYQAGIPKDMALFWREWHAAMRMWRESFRGLPLCRSWWWSNARRPKKIFGNIMELQGMCPVIWKTILCWGCVTWRELHTGEEDLWWYASEWEQVWGVITGAGPWARFYSPTGICGDLSWWRHAAMKEIHPIIFIRRNWGQGRRQMWSSGWAAGRMDSPQSCGARLRGFVRWG